MTLPPGMPERYGLAAILQDYERRLEALERSARAGYTSIGVEGLVIREGGTIRWVDGAGDEIGRIDPEDGGLLTSISKGERVGAFGEIDATEGWTTITDGPSVNVEVGVSGQLVVLLRSYIGPQVDRTGYFSIDVSGATSVEPDEDLYSASFFGVGARQAGADIAPNAFAYFLLGGLNEGSHTVEARYRVTGTMASDDCYFSSRELIVIPI